MKICFIADGMSTHTQNWVRHFARNHTVNLITYDPMGISIEGVTEHVIRSRFRNLYLAFWPRHRRIQSLIRTIRPDLIHAHFVTKYGFHIPWRGEIPCIITAWGDDILILPEQSRLIQAFTGFVLRRADRVHAVSEDMRQRIISRYGISPGKVRHVPFGVDTRAFSPGSGRGKERKDTLIVFSNRKFWPVHSNETLIDAFARAHPKNPGMRLILKGMGPEEQKLRDRIAQRNMGEDIMLDAHSGQDRVPDDLRASDIYVTSAKSDGTPVSLLEAMSTGLPCIATAVGGIPEWIRNGENGILVPPGDSEAMADAILRLAADSGLRRELGARARETIVARGDWQVLMRGVEEEYEDLIHRHRSGCG